MPIPSSSIIDIAIKIKGFITKRIPATVFYGVVIVILTPYVLKYLTRENTTPDLPSANRTLGIKQLISDVKAELYQLETERIEKKEAPLFAIKQFDLEISFVARANSRQKGGIEYQVVTADSEIETGIEKVQKLTLHLETIEASRIPGKLTTFDPSVNSGQVIDQPQPKKGEKP